VELLDSYGWTRKGSPVRVMSFSYVALNRIKKLAPDLDVVMLVDRVYAFQLTKNLLGTDWIAGPGIDLLRDNPRFRSRLARSGRPIHVWTVNTPEDLDLCVELGVEAVITDTPGKMLRHLRGGR
jgi:glycerophosphoryl diester phosphodiesterase